MAVKMKKKKQNKRRKTKKKCTPGRTKSCEVELGGGQSRYSMEFKGGGGFPLMETRSSSEVLYAEGAFRKS